MITLSERRELELLQFSAPGIERQLHTAAGLVAVHDEVLLVVGHRPDAHDWQTSFEVLGPICPVEAQSLIGE